MSATISITPEETTKWLLRHKRRLQQNDEPIEVIRLLLAVQAPTAKLSLTRYGQGVETYDFTFATDEDAVLFKLKYL